MKTKSYLIILICVSFSLVYGNSENIISSKSDTNAIGNRDTTKHKANLTGGRSRKSIMAVVMNNIHELKDAYNRRLKLKGKPYFGGKLYIKFAIDEFGKVMFCETAKDSLGDSTLASQCVFIVKSWQFDNINKPGDITEVIYPFIFSPPEQQTEDKSEWHGKYILIPVLICVGVITMAVLSLLLIHN